MFDAIHIALLFQFQRINSKWQLWHLYRVVHGERYLLACAIHLLYLTFGNKCHRELSSTPISPPSDPWWCGKSFFGFGPAGNLIKQCVEFLNTPGLPRRKPVLMVALPDTLSTRSLRCDATHDILHIRREVNFGSLAVL